MLPQKMIKLGSQRSVIRELFEFGKKRAAEIGAENVFDFSIGNPSVPAPDGVNHEIIRLIRESDPVTLHGYTSAQGDTNARETIAQSVKRRHGVNFRADNFYMTVGAAAALSCALTGLSCPEDEFIVFAPYFPEYKVFIESAGAQMVVIPADIESFQIDFEAFEKAITPRTKGVIVNSPNNPSGAVYSEETIVRLSEILLAKSKEHGEPIYLISDEPYREIVFTGVTVPYIPKYYENTIVCYSWSKSLSLPGERMGYVLVPDSVTDSETVYAAIAGAGRALGYVNAPALFQRVCAKCCDMTADVSVYERNRDLLMTNLREYGYHVVEPGGTFYLFPRSLEPDAVAFSERAKKYNLLVVPGDGFGCPGHVRISFCVPTERVERALPYFKALAEEYK